MTKVYTINWTEIQNYYNEECISCKELGKRFGITMSLLFEAVKLKLFKTRTRSEAISKQAKAFPRKHCKETKEKMSKARKKFLKENPDKVPYLLNHVHKRKFASEEYFAECLKDSTFILKYRLGTYELDFADVERKIDLEIDGNQHFVDERIVEHDKKRNDFMSKLGWTVIRIKWAVFQAAPKEEKEEVIKAILNGYAINKDYVFVYSSDLNSDFLKYFESKKIKVKKQKSNRRTRWGTKEELEKLYLHYNKNVVQLAKHFNISDNGMKKRLKAYGLFQSKYEKKVSLPEIESGLEN